VTVKEGSKWVADLEYKIKNAKEIKAKELKEADAEVKKCKKTAEETLKKWSSKEQEEGSLVMELGKINELLLTTYRRYGTVLYYRSTIPRYLPT